MEDCPEAGLEVVSLLDPSNDIITRESSRRETLKSLRNELNVCNHLSETQQVITLSLSVIKDPHTQKNLAKEIKLLAVLSETATKPNDLPT